VIGNPKLHLNVHLPHQNSASLLSQLYLSFFTGPTQKAKLYFFAVRDKERHWQLLSQKSRATESRNLPFSGSNSFHLKLVGQQEVLAKDPGKGVSLSQQKKTKHWIVVSRKKAGTKGIWLSSMNC
jgi:hypothetical protein